MVDALSRRRDFFKPSGGQEKLGTDPSIDATSIHRLSVSQSVQSFDMQLDGSRRPEKLKCPTTIHMGPARISLPKQLAPFIRE